MSIDMTDTIAPKSDQLNADDLLGSPRTVTVTNVTRGDADQPVNIVTAEFGEERPYKPCKSMRRVLVAAWGTDASAYVGRRVTLFNDTSVKWGGVAVGGIRISALSHIDKPLTVSLTETRGKRKPHRIDPLADAPAPKNAGPSLGDLFDKAGLPKDRAADRIVVVRKVVGRPDIASAGDLNADELAALTTQLAEWDAAGKLTAEVGDILDLAAIEAEGKS